MRDLGLHEATHGRVSAFALRSAGMEGTGWHCHSAELRVLYVVRGSCEWSLGSLEITRLETGACVSLPPGMPVSMLKASPGTEILDVLLGSPELAACPPADGKATPGKPVVAALTESSWETGAGRRAFLAYRDLGVAEASGGRLRAHVTRATGKPGETGWHYHTCELQVVYRLEGRGMLLFEENKPISFEVDSCICIPPGAPHDERRDTNESVVLEFVIGEMGTVSCEPPSMGKERS